jgi:UDP-N-acetylglucosamine 1-carboxyvinyltransferase
MTDWQQPFVVLLTQAEGSSIIHETVYENRFGYTTMLKEMGANVELYKQCLGEHSCRFSVGGHDHSLIVTGKTALQGRAIEIPDLRAGFAYVMAALIASDQSQISGISFLKRGYERIVEKLSSLGADISEEKVEVSETREVCV